MSHIYLYIHGEREYRRIGLEMSLNEVAKMRVVFEPLVMFLFRKTIVPETTRTK